MSILDDSANVVHGPVGEHVPEDPLVGCFPPQDNVNSGETFRLEEAPSALIDPCIPTLNDYEDGVLSTFGSPNLWNGGSAQQNFDNLRNLAPFPDRDGDQIADDADFSGIAGDSPCTGGATSGCDDNCAGLQNAGQADTGGPGGSDGQGDGCQCGDPTGDDDTTAADVLELRELRVGLRSELTVPERCSVHSDGQCSLADLVVLDRELRDCELDLRLGQRRVIDVMTIFHRKERRDLSAAVRFYLGRVAGEPVATAALVATGEVAGIYWVATRERFRGRGFGAAATWAATSNFLSKSTP